MLPWVGEGGAGRGRAKQGERKQGEAGREEAGLRQGGPGQSLTAAAKPQAHQTMAPMQVSSRFLIRMLRVFLVRTEPASRKPKPAWVQKTSAQSNPTQARTLALTLALTLP